LCVFADAVQPPAAIAFWGPRRGLLASGTAVLLTTDGGRRTHVVLRTKGRVIALQAFGANDAIVDLAGGHALRTLDGGQTWANFRHRFHADFVSPRVGIGVRLGRYGLVRGLTRTEDGGRTWQAAGSPCGGNSSAVIVELVTPRLGWTICLSQPGAGNQLKSVFRTADGGRTWRRLRGDLGSYGYGEGASFAPDGFGLVWEGRGTLYVTRDGGDHWTPKPKVAQPEIDFGGGASAFSGGRGLVLLTRGGRSARLLATRDFGRTWQLVRRWR
jgi:photosystem II stability/assembly factor-like uncharacterized protein